MALPASPHPVAGKTPLRWRPAQLLSWVLVVSTTLTLLALLLPEVPYLSVLGTFFGPYLLPYLLGLALSGLLLAGAVWHRGRKRLWLVLLGLAGATVVGLVSIAARQVALARNVGVPISLAQAVGATTPGEAQPDSTLAYTTAGGAPVLLSIFRPTGHPAPAAPVLLRIHGGGWIGGDRLIDAATMRWFAAQGWVVVSVDYTLSSAKQHLWQLTEKQIACAMAWTAQHIAAYGGDATHLALTGDSAGGNLALNCAYQANAGTLISECGGTVPRVQAVAVLYLVVSPASFYDNPDPVLGSVARMMAGGYLGAAPAK